MIYNTLIFSILILTGFLYSQTYDTTSTIPEQLIENVVPEPVANNEEFNAIDYLEELQQNPINLNTADLTSLTKIPGLDMDYAQLIIQYREKYGHFFSINELYAIKGLPKYVLNNIKVFIVVTDPLPQSKNDAPINNSIFNFEKIFFRSRISENLNDKEISHNFQGSKIKLYNKFSVQNEQCEAAILTEKDPGEKSYYDFISFHLLFKKIGPVEKVILGDYIGEFGKGLVLGMPYGFSKNTVISFTNRTRESIFDSYNSTDESRFFRGIAVSTLISKFHFAFFYSSHKLDASTDSISLKISSLITTGYHQTISDLINHNSLNESFGGGTADYTNDNSLHLGVLYCFSKFSRPFSGSNLYSLQGDRFNYFSTCYEYIPIPSINLSGETAYDTKSIASINTLRISFNKNFLFLSSIRNYPRNFNSIYGRSLAEQKDKVQNETGFYNGFKLLTDFGSINFYYDQFLFPFGSYRFPISNTGEEYLCSYTNTFKESLNLNINYKYEDKDYLLNQDDQKSIARRERNDFRVILTWRVSKELRLKTIINYNTIRIKDNNIKERGILFGNSFILNLIKKLKLSGVISFFQTDSFYSSVYEYDTNIEGLVRGEVLYGEGMKLKLSAKYNLLNGLTISAQYSEILKPKELLISPIYSTLTDNIVLQIELLL
jgi:competence ComEA-like helix-hairpin-helix protein